MAFLQWRRFNFFEKEILRDVSTNEPFDKLQDVDVSACTSGRGQMIVADYDGYVHLVNRQLDVSTFRAYELRVSHLYQMRQHNILVSIGEDEEGINPLIKVWNLDKRDKLDNPACTRIVRAIPGNIPAKVTCLVVHENLNHMAVGFQNGSVVLFKGDVTRDRHSKQHLIYEGSFPVSGVSFKSQSRATILFIATEGTIISICITNKDKEVVSVLETHGCQLGCSTMTDKVQDCQFVIGRREAVYFYQNDGRGQCLAFDGQKLQLHWFRSFLIVVGRETKPLPRAGVAGGSQPVQMYTLTVYDIANKFIAFSAPVPEVISVVCEWGVPHILTVDRKFYSLLEKDTQTKLESLFKKNLFVVAISLAQSQDYDQDGVIDIYRQYGDHLYSKGDHNGSIQQYIKTIGRVEASYVIRKFLDAARIHNLTCYLEALHKAQLASEDHTTLLLNCYTKLKDVTKLDQFIMTTEREVTFDLETAIRVCRSAGYYSHALFLAERLQQHDLYLKIQLDDIHDHQGALKYIGKLDFEEAERNLKKYGKVLICEVADETTALLKTLCTDYRGSETPLVDHPEGGVARIQRANADEFIHIFVNNSQKLTEFLEHMVKVQPSSPPLVCNTLLELYLQRYIDETDISKKEEKERQILDLLQNSDAAYDLDQALILCQMHNFKAGILYLYEKAKLYQQILNYHMDHNQYAHIIETCKRFGCHDSNLWSQALSYFARKESDCRKEILEILAHIDKSNLLPPLIVVQTLAHNSTATLAVVKDYITRRLQQENDQIGEDERLIAQYREETQKMRSEIEELRTSAKIFQVSKCSICSHPLEVPSVHFLCQHSYHHHCFESYAENDSECPACLPENRKIQDIIRAQEQSRDLHEHFERQLERAPDGFSVVADYFGRGIFNKVTLLSDPEPRRPEAGTASLQREQLLVTHRD